LHAKGQADLLDNNFDSARKTLEKAHALSPSDHTIVIDLASAYFERAETGESIDYTQAINLLREVTKNQPQNDVAWFNLAIILERMHIHREALDAWDTYFKVAPQSAWSDEAKIHREAIQQLIQEHDKKSNQPLLDPATIVKLDPEKNSAAFRTLDERIESYLDASITSWLPQIGQTNRGNRSSLTIRHAAETIAQVALKNHQDRWPEELIQDVDQSTSNVASQALSNAITLNGEGKYTLSSMAARTAKQEFLHLGSIAGHSRARFEELYAHHLSQQAQKCYWEAGVLLQEIYRRSYIWLEIQTNLERAICANMLGRMNEARMAAREALELAQKHAYGGLYLRGAALFVVLDWTSGDVASATKLATESLRIFWSGPFPPVRGYGLYSALDSIAEDADLWFLQVSICREAIRLMAGDKDHSLLAVEHQRLGSAALRSGEHFEAEKHFQESVKQFSQTRSSASVEVLRAVTKIGLARLACIKGQFADAISLLEEARPWIEKTSNRFISLDFYLSQGDAFLESGQDEAAMSAASHAIDIAEAGLQTIPGERERLNWAQKYAAAYRLFVRLLLARDPHEAFQRWEWYKGAPLRNPQERYRIRRTPYPYADDTVLISYILWPNQVAAWLHSRSQTEYRILSISPASVQDLGQKLLEYCNNHNSDENQIANYGRQLYNALIFPFASSIRKYHNLIIETDGALDALPFEVLLSPSGRYLEEDINIAISSGETYLLSAKKTLDVTSHPQMLAVGIPFATTLGRDSLDAISDAAFEAAQIARLMPNSELLIGHDATRSAITHSIQSVDIFYFAGHAVASRDGSSLILGGTSETSPEVLTASHLQAIKVSRLRLVILSACASAGNEEHTLSESNSLARTFLALRVPQVIASRWSVDSSVTARFMDHFYHNLLTTGSVGGALRLTRQKIKAIGYSHPYYWAAFSVFGQS
jgi:CHAT domain-containing protein/Flp pilus assembly protein TadD/predicted negative regulator of RcsB-dependent stress response